MVDVIGNMKPSTRGMLMRACVEAGSELNPPIPVYRRVMQWDSDHDWDRVPVAMSVIAEHTSFLSLDTKGMYRVGLLVEVVANKRSMLARAGKKQSTDVGIDDMVEDWMYIMLMQWYYLVSTKCDEVNGGPIVRTFDRDASSIREWPDVGDSLQGLVASIHIEI